MRRYHNFDEINRDLRLLKLQSDINKEELKASLEKTKDSLAPKNLIGGMLGGLATSAVALKLLVPVAGFAINKLVRKFT